MREARAFAETFFAAFDSRCAQELLADAWRRGGFAWTRPMLGRTVEADSILRATAQAWAHARGGGKVSLHHNWYTIDLAVLTPPFEGDAEYWDTTLLAAIEHENGQDIETEMWKLAHWRAHLKVLVFYRYVDQPHLDRRVANMGVLVKRAQASLPAGDGDYLLLAGCDHDGHVHWRAYIWNGEAFECQEPPYASALRLR